MRRSIRILAAALLAFSLSIGALSIGALSTGALSAGPAGDKEKIKPEELIAKHLQSIGTPEARAAAASRIITGMATVNFKQGGHGQSQGKAVLASQGTRSIIAMAFGLTDYPAEKIAYNGQKVSVSQIRPGVRTILGRFLTTNDFPFREGLAGGVLSSAWPLLDLSKRNAKVQYDGLKKVDKRQLHALKYSGQKSSDLKVTLFFDPETFQHVRTEYHQTIENSVAANKPGESVAQQETKINIIEEFSDFKAESGLTLPHAYRLQLEITGTSGALLYEWMLSLDKFDFSQQINEKEFDLEAS